MHPGPARQDAGPVHRCGGPCVAGHPPHARLRHGRGGPLRTFRGRRNGLVHNPRSQQRRSGRERPTVRGRFAVHDPVPRLSGSRPPASESGLTSAAAKRLSLIPSYRAPLPGITDVHVHVEPYRSLKPAILDLLWREIPDRPYTSRLMDDPRAFLEHLDKAGVERACLINYVSPEVMGFTEDVNRFIGEFAKEDRKRLIPFGSVHPKRTKDPKRDVERLASKWEMGGMKIHPPHQLFAANAYADGKLPALRTIYKTAERLKMPIMVHTGTSVFPGARSKFGDPMALDDVAQDCPDLTILMAHGGRPLWCDTAFYLLRRHRNLHLDISSIPPKRLLEWFPRLEEISAKVVFGSDWPAPGVPGIREEIEGLRSLALSERTKERILSENAAALVK
ncbi:MAG: amidohydrolase [Methanobacteriota archaeon]|nr:MAG: amidohydrolase [Euryarchaeota archaeon]